jgi:spore germination protein GerM
LRALLRIYQQPGAAHPLAAASDIRSIYLVDPGAAVIDLNSAFADQHRSGILSEQLTVNSLVQTLAANVPGIQRVNILVEGKTRETLAGHADLSEWFDVPTIMQPTSQ